MKFLKSMKKTTKIDFATYLGVIVAFAIMFVLQDQKMLSRAEESSRQGQQDARDRCRQGG